MRSAAMDVSDGLAGDLAKLCRASGVSATIEVARVPLSAAARSGIAADAALIETVLTGGDDYEIVATVPPRKLEAFAGRRQGRESAAHRDRRDHRGDDAPRFLDAQTASRCCSSGRRSVISDTRARRPRGQGRFAWMTARP